MSEDSGQSKTFQASEQRLKKARADGNSLYVTQINSGLLMVAFFIFFSFITTTIVELYNFTFDKIILAGSNAKATDLYATITPIVIKELTTIIRFIAFFALITFTSAIIQLKGLRLVPLKIKIESFNLIKNAQQKFSKKNLIKLFLDIGFIVIFLIIGFGICTSNISALVNSIYLLIGPQLVLLDYLYTRIIFLTALSLTIFILLIYSIEKFFYLADLMMTREEMEKEHENNEGKAEVKGRIRELRQELYEEDDFIDALLDDLGTFVVSNPTHYAIMLFYSKETLPLVLLKGKGSLAKIIMHRTTLKGMPVIPNKYVARQLYATTKAGEFIPKYLIQDIGMIIGQNYNLIKPFIRDKAALQKMK